MTIGFFSPLPPQRTGVAAYSAALLAALRRHADVRTNDPRAEIALYHLGNNRLHADIYRRALAQPGVVVLHDAVLHHLLLGLLTEAEYIEEFAYNYGDWMRDLARELWRDRARSAGDSRYFQYPLLRRLAERSRAIIVHNRGAVALVRRHRPDANVVEIPHLYAPPQLPDAAAVEETRAALGVHRTRFLAGVFGHLRESKRLPSVFAALRGLNAALLVAGDFVSPELEDACRPELASAIRLPYVDEETFWRLASAVDACVNLRYPGAGETSGIATRLMGLGKPVILTASLETEGYPETACVRIDPGPPEVEMLRAVLECWIGAPHLAAEVGRRAGLYIQNTHNIDAVVERYLEVLG
ncbi:MAG: hypothetical protein SFV54_03210 [Bryobacteraceae bacterium]|nr:hypothetical protein [Bryobacteraceae bacterium]